MVEELHTGVVAFMASGLVFGGLLALDHRAKVAPEARSAEVPVAAVDPQHVATISR